MRNAMAYAGKTQRRIVSAWIGTAFAQEDAAAARKQWREVADQARPRVPKLAGLMDNAEADVLAYMGFPAQRRAKIHSTDALDKPLVGRVRQRGGKSCVAEVALDHAATVVICGVVSSISAGMSEPPWVRRRLFGLSQAAMRGRSLMA